MANKIWLEAMRRNAEAAQEYADSLSLTAELAEIASLVEQHGKVYRPIMDIYELHLDDLLEGEDFGLRVKEVELELPYDRRFPYEELAKMFVGFDAEITSSYAEDYPDLVKIHHSVCHVRCLQFSAS